MTNKMRAIYPGEILQDELEAIEYSANRFASALHVPTNRITAILKGNVPSQQIGFKISAIFGHHTRALA